MNIAVKAFNQTAAPIVLSWSISIKQQFILWLVTVLVLLSALSLIHIRNLDRFYVNEYQGLQEKYQTLRIDESQLLLEKSTWSIQSRVEQIARYKLNMMTPEADKIILLVHKE